MEINESFLARPDHLEISNAVIAISLTTVR
jgi:hypothetical protein